MTKKLLFLISVVCGVLAVFTISTSNVQGYQAHEYPKTEIVSQYFEIAQSNSTQRNIPEECERECRWYSFGGLLRIFCEYVEEPKLEHGGNPSCYRQDWDPNGDGVMEILQQ